MNLLPELTDYEEAPVEKKENEEAFYFVILGMELI